MEKDIEKIKGADAFLESSDTLFLKIAKYLDKYEVGDEPEELDKLRDVCEIVKITATTIKTLREEPKKKSPLEKMKSKSNGDQILV